MVLLYQSRLGPKKPNLKIAWAGPYQIEWVYTNGSVKLIDLAGLTLPGFYNASKIKHYEYSQASENSPVNQLPEEEEVDPNLQDLFAEPVVGSVELITTYSTKWAAVIDDENQSNSDSMETAMEDWESEIDERSHSVKEMQHFSLSGYFDEGEVQKGDMSEEKSIRRINEGKAKHMKDAVLTEGGREILNWVKFKFNQCMFDTWHNGTHLCLLNTLILRDCVNCVMMGLHRALQQTPNNPSKNLNTKHSHAVAPSFTCTSPCPSSIPSLCSLSPLIFF